MKFLAFLLLMNVSASFAQEFCLDESHGSIMSLSQDVIDADNKVQMKDLKKWYKKKTTKEEADQFYMASRSVYDSSSSNCSVKNVMGIDIQYCSTADQTKATYIPRQDIALKEGDKKSNNKFLAQVFSKEDGKITRVERQKAGAYGKEVFNVFKELKNGEHVLYVIDPSINPGHNPIQISHIEKKKSEFVQFFNVGIGAGFSGSFGFGYY